MSTLTVAQARSDAAAAGFTGAALDTIVAIAQAESSLVTDARNVNADSHTFPDGHTGPSTDRGILQINDWWWPQVTSAMADDPAVAFQWGWTISQSGTDFSAWATYESGAYLAYMPPPTPAPTGTGTGISGGNNGMLLTGELAPLGLAHRQSEFIIAPVGPNTGQRIFGACGPTALASAATAALQRLVTAEQVFALMEPRGLCDAEGVSDDGKIAAAASAAGGLGLSILEHYPYANDMWAGWPNFLGWHIGSQAHPTVLELANGQALVDEISGASENAVGLKYHFICLLKKHPGGMSAYAGRALPSGYWACDGDSFAGGNNRANGFNAADELQFYSDATLSAALPCAAIAFARVATPPTSGGGTGTTMWHQVSASPLVMADSNNVETHFAMAAYLAANPTLGDVVSGCPGETYIDNGETSILPLDGATSLVYVKATGAAHPDLTGGVLWSLHQWLAEAQATLATAQSDLAAAQAEIQTLKNTPPPAPVQVPVPEPLTPTQQAAIDAIAAIRAALA